MDRVSLFCRKLGQYQIRYYVRNDLIQRDINRLNCGIKNRFNFFIHAIFFISDYWNWLSELHWIWEYQKFDPIPWN